MEKTELVKQIIELKKLKNAVILCHYYQNIEIDQVADFVGDSLYLSQQAANTDADIIIFAGVFFMAETAKILSPNKKVILPRMESGCIMADMININDLRKFKQQHPNVPTVCYINTNADIKAESDICCTSANAVKVVNSLHSKEVLFVPDRGLGAYVGSQLPDKNVILYPGYCPTHMRIRVEDINNSKKQYPEAKILLHPECHMEVIKLADYVGSTSGIIKTAKTSNHKQFIIGTEKGVVERLQRDCPDKQFILPTNKAVCENMKWNTLIDILFSLKSEKPEIHVDIDIANKAYSAIYKMLQIE